MKNTRLIIVALAALHLVWGQDGIHQAPGRLWVRIRDERGQPLAARIYLTDLEGKAHVPAGAIARQTSRTREFYFHADGEFRLGLRG